MATLLDAILTGTTPENAIAVNPTEKRVQRLLQRSFRSDGGEDWTMTVGRARPAFWFWVIVLAATVPGIAVGCYYLWQRLLYPLFLVSAVLAVYLVWLWLRLPVNRIERRGEVLRLHHFGMRSPVVIPLADITRIRAGDFEFTRRMSLGEYITSHLSTTVIEVQHARPIVMVGVARPQVLARLVADATRLPIDEVAGVPSNRRFVGGDSAIYVLGNNLVGPWWLAVLVLTAVAIFGSVLGFTSAPPNEMDVRPGPDQTQLDTLVSRIPGTATGATSEWVVVQNPYCNDRLWRYDARFKCPDVRVQKDYDQQGFRALQERANRLGIHLTPERLVPIPGTERGFIIARHEHGRYQVQMAMVSDIGRESADASKVIPKREKVLNYLAG